MPNNENLSSVEKYLADIKNELIRMFLDLETKFDLPTLQIIPENKETLSGLVSSIETELATNDPSTSYYRKFSGDIQTFKYLLKSLSADLYNKKLRGELRDLHAKIVIHMNEKHEFKNYHLLEQTVRSLHEHLNGHYDLSYRQYLADIVAVFDYIEKDPTKKIGINALKYLSKIHRGQIYRSMTKKIETRSKIVLMLNAYMEIFDIYDKYNETNGKFIEIQLHLDRDPGNVVLQEALRKLINIKALTQGTRDQKLNNLEDHLKIKKLLLSEFQELNNDINKLYNNHIKFFSQKYYSTSTFQKFLDIIQINKDYVPQKMAIIESLLGFQIGDLQKINADYILFLSNRRILDILKKFSDAIFALQCDSANEFYQKSLESFFDLKLKHHFKHRIFGNKAIHTIEAYISRFYQLIPGLGHKKENEIKAKLEAISQISEIIKLGPYLEKEYNHTD